MSYGSISVGNISLVLMVSNSGTGHVKVRTKYTIHLAWIGESSETPLVRMCGSGPQCSAFIMHATNTGCICFIAVYRCYCVIL